MDEDDNGIFRPERVNPGLTDNAVLSYLESYSLVTHHILYLRKNREGGGGVDSGQYII